ncbi:type 1 glutamine amidotransferase [Methanoregula sp.]|uniref:type 1 glutamine amidotransferase n=1 Tax=Methanoregula sp. TaxID=2052170 RepID=UPI003C75DE7E
MITIFQHGKDESAGEITTCLEEYGTSFDIVRLFETNETPTEIPASLIVLGGQMSVNETEEYSYFIREKEIIREMITRQRPVFGICLGAQMIASAFGERVFPSTPERGWCRVYGDHLGNTFPFPQIGTVFHWHDETFNLPMQATLLLQGDRVKNQAFRLGSAVGVQFHPEVTLKIISRWSEKLCPRERNQLLRDSEHEIEGNKERCGILTEKFLNGWGR